MKKEEVIEYIKSQMKPYTNVHFIGDFCFSVRFYCIYCSLNNDGIKSIINKYPLVYPYIDNGLLCFDYRSYVE